MTELKSKPLIEPGAIYLGVNASGQAPQNGEPPEFGIYPIGERFVSVVSEYIADHRNDKGRTTLNAALIQDIGRPITKDDLNGLSLDAVSGSHDLFKSIFMAAFMNSKSGFSEVSKQEFATAYLKAAEQPAALGMFSYVALTSAIALSKDKTNDAMTIVGKMASKIWNSDEYRGEFKLSAKEFTVNEFAANPFTVEEIRALPFVLGQFKEIYAEVEHNHAIHAQACVGKLRSAGYDLAADVILENFPEKAAKPVSKHDEPGFGM
jgi:hypothetical protein